MVVPTYNKQVKTTDSNWLKCHENWRHSN